MQVTNAQIIKTTPTLQVVVNPNVLPSTVQGAGALAALDSLSPEFPRFVPWCAWQLDLKSLVQS
jgi:hypothetical protein